MTVYWRIIRNSVNRILWNAAESSLWIRACWSLGSSHYFESATRFIWLTLLGTYWRKRGFWRARRSGTIQLSSFGTPSEILSDSRCGCVGVRSTFSSSTDSKGHRVRSGWHSLMPKTSEGITFNQLWDFARKEKRGTSERCWEFLV